MSISITDHGQAPAQAGLQHRTLYSLSPVALSPSNEPAWVQNLRKTALDHWLNSSLPKRSEEDWRRTAPGRFALSFSREDWLRNEAGVLALSCPSTLELATDEPNPAVISKPLHLALTENPELESHLFLSRQHTEDYFASQNAAFGQNGSYTLFPRHVTASNPIFYTHSFTAPAAEPMERRAYAFPHSVVVAEPFSRGTVVERFSSNEHPLQSVSVLELEVQEGASLEYVLASDWGSRTNSLTSIHVHLAKDASLKLLFIGAGGATNKLFLTSQLNDCGARSEIYGAVFSDRRTHFDLDTLQIHHKPSCYSNVLCSCAVKDKGRTIFSGNIYVAKDAQKTDAYQKNQNLLLSHGAHAYSNPKLEILADDVRCTHGSNFHSFDEEQLFYLQSRGLAPASARRLLITGFFQDVIERIDNEQVVEHISSFIAEKLKASLGSE